MNPTQAPLLLRFFFNRTRCTNTQPNPMLRWHAEDVQVIRDELNADPGIHDEVTNSIEDLTKLLTHYLDNQPKLTRG